MNRWTEQQLQAAEKVEAPSNALVRELVAALRVSYARSDYLDARHSLQSVTLEAYLDQFQISHMHGAEAEAVTYDARLMRQFRDNDATIGTRIGDALSALAFKLNVDNPGGKLLDNIDAAVDLLIADANTVKITREKLIGLLTDLQGLNMSKKDIGDEDYLNGLTDGLNRRQSESINTRNYSHGYRQGSNLRDEYLSQESD